jgi:hypothetical protein
MDPKELAEKVRIYYTSLREQGFKHREAMELCGMYQYAEITAARGDKKEPWE